MSLFHVKHAPCLHRVPIQLDFGNGGQEKLGTGGIQFREASTPAVRVEFRCKVINEDYRRIPEYRVEISNLCYRDRGHEPLRFTSGKAVLHGMTIDAESQIRPMWSRLRITAQSVLCQ